MSTRSRRASNASDTSQEASQAVDGAALGAQLAALSAAVKEIADQQSKDREAAKALEAERAAAVAGRHNGVEWFLCWRRVSIYVADAAGGVCCFGAGWI